MNICFFTENYYKGGLDTFLINLVNSWPNDDDVLTLTCNGNHAGLETIETQVIRQISIEKYNYVFTSDLSKKRDHLTFRFSFFLYGLIVLASRFLQYPFLAMWYVLTLTSYFKGSKFDRLMVVNGGYPASLLGRCAIIAWWLAGKKNEPIMNFHNSASPSPWYSKIFDNLIDRYVVRFSSHIISVSSDCLDSLRSRPAFVGCDKLSFIYNGISDPAIQEDFECLGFNKPKVQPYFLMLATYEERKGHSYLLKAFQSLVLEFPDAKLKIFGHGQSHELARVEEEVFGLGLCDKVTLGSFQSDINELLCGAVALVVPSQSHESFGLTIIEAMSRGVPVVTTDVGGMPEVLNKSGAGYVCSRDNYLEFGLKLRDILKYPELASELAMNGRKTFEERYSAIKMARKYAALIRK